MHSSSVSRLPLCVHYAHWENTTMRKPPFLINPLYPVSRGYKFVSLTVVKRLEARPVMKIKDLQPYLITLYNFCTKLTRKESDIDSSFQKNVHFLPVIEGLVIHGSVQTFIRAGEFLTKDLPSFSLCKSGHMIWYECSKWRPCHSNVQFAWLFYLRNWNLNQIRILMQCPCHMWCYLPLVEGTSVPPSSEDFPCLGKYLNETWMS